MTPGSQSEDWTVVSPNGDWAVVSPNGECSYTLLGSFRGSRQFGNKATYHWRFLDYVHRHYRIDSLAKQTKHVSFYLNSGLAILPYVAERI